MIGTHCIKTWSVVQGPWALSSGEAELYGLVEGVTRAKGLISLAQELGFEGLENIVQLGTDSSAAKSFVTRRGLGRMRHLEIRDLWLQREVREGRVIVEKIAGVENPADLMTKILPMRDIEERLRRMNLEMKRLKRRVAEDERADEIRGDEVCEVSTYGGYRGSLRRSGRSLRTHNTPPHGMGSRPTRAGRPLGG